MQKKKPCPTISEYCETRFDKLERLVYLAIGILLGVGALDLGKLLAGM